MRIVIELAGPPQGKGRGRAVNTPAGVRVYTPAKTVRYESQLRYAATQVMAGRAPIDGPVRVRVTMRFPVPVAWSKKKRAEAFAGRIWPTVKPDWDNGAKLLDALNMVAVCDDKQVVDGQVLKVYSDRPGLTIEIDTLPLEARPWPDQVQAAAPQPQQLGFL